MTLLAQIFSIRIFFGAGAKCGRRQKVTEGSIKHFCFFFLRDCSKLVNNYSSFLMIYLYITIISQLFIFRIIQFNTSRLLTIICSICSETWSWTRFCCGRFWFWHKKRTYVFVWCFWGWSDVATFLASLVNLLRFLDFVGWSSFSYIFLFLYKRLYRIWIFSFIVKDIHILSKYNNQFIVLYGRWHKYFKSAWYLQTTLKQRWDTIISWSKCSKSSRTSIK